MRDLPAVKSALLLLAAGNSSRMGAFKQLLDFQGKTLLRHAAEVAIASGCDPVVVVLGAREQELRMTLAGLDVEVAVNRRWADGVGTSIQTGLRALETRDVRGTVVALADQPFVSSDFLRGLAVQRDEWNRSIIASRFAGTVGVPAFFARPAFPLLMALQPDQCCKGVILSHPGDTLLVDCPEAAIDINTPEDYRHISAA